MTSQHVSAADCIFCKIIAGGIPAQKVYEDGETLAFLDIRPVSEGHTLIIPKDHFENIHTIPDEAWCRLMLAVKKIATAVRHATNADGINIGMNNEPAAGQEVMHAHVHVMPRHNDDGKSLWAGKPYKTPEEAQTFAEKIQAELKNE